LADVLKGLPNNHLKSQIMALFADQVWVHHFGDGAIVGTFGFQKWVQNMFSIFDTHFDNQLCFW
jgi:hypothetical protein